MTWNRWLVGAICAIFLAAGLYQALGGFSAPYEGTDWRASKSCLYIRTPPPDKEDKFGQGSAKSAPGMLLLAVGGDAVRTLAEARTQLSSPTVEKEIVVDLWDPKTDRSRKLRTRPEDVLVRLNAIPPAVWVKTVFADGPAAAAGLRRGDLILDLDGKAFSTYREADPLRRLIVTLLTLGDPNGMAPYNADAMILQQEPGHTVTVSILRDGSVESKRIILASRGLAYPFGLYLPMALTVLILGVWQFLNSTRLPFAFIASMGHLLLLQLGRSGRFDITFMLLDLALGLPLLAWISLHWLPVVPLRSPVMLLLRRRVAQVPETPSPAGSALLASLAVLVVFLLLPSGFPTAIPPLLWQRVLSTGGASIFVFALLFWVFSFGLHYLVQIFQMILQPVNPENALNRAIRAAFRQKSTAGVGELLDRDSPEAFGYYGHRLTMVRRHFASKPDSDSLALLIEDLLDRDDETASRAFSVLRWCEAALPLLGFLGTVLGIGWAVPQMSSVLRSSNQGPDVIGGLEIAFRDLGLAFDTTLVGLIGLLFLGVIHSFAARRVAMCLAEARELLQDYVAALEPTSVMAQLVLLNTHTAIISAKLVAAGEQMQHVIANGQEPPWLEIRRVLNLPVIAFEEVSPIARQSRRQFLEKRGLSDASFEVVASGGSRGLGFAVLRGQNNIRQILRFGLDTRGEEALFAAGEQIAVAVASPDGDFVTAVTPNGTLKEVLFPGKGEAKIDRQLHLPPANHRHGWGIRREHRQLLVLADKNIHWNVRCCFFGESGEPIDLSRGAPWKEVYCHPSSGTIVVLEGGQSHVLVRHRIVVSPPQIGKNRPGAYLEREKGDLRFLFNLSSSRMYLLTAGELLVIEKDSGSTSIHLGDFQGRWETLRVPPEWPSKITELHTGADGWFAVVNEATGELSMWRIRRPNLLEPYREGGVMRTHQVGPVSGLAATLDGRFLMAPVGKEVATWKFPKFGLDQGIGGER